MLFRSAGHDRFAGIVRQEYSVAEQKLIGARKLIFEGTPLGFTEAPHLYKRGGYYYLLTAEGGTHWGHAVTMARSKTLDGPYELHPQTPMLTARDRPDAPLQRAGHADLVETPNGDTYMVYLCGRPLRNRGRCTLGRETAIQKMVWGEDGWLRTEAGDTLPRLEPPAPRLPAHPFPCRLSARILTTPCCRSISSGCARRIPTKSSASPLAAVICASMAVKVSVRFFVRRSSRGACRRIV